VSGLSGRRAGTFLDRIYKIFHDYHVNPVNPVKRSLFKETRLSLMAPTTPLEIRRDRSPETSSDLHDIVRCLDQGRSGSL